MVYYRFNYTYPHRQLIDIELSFDTASNEQIELYIAAWRPGRYELQNYAKNIIKFEVFGDNNQALAFEKNTRNSWIVKPNDPQRVIVKYTYFAHQMDAGGSWLDDSQLYINPITCCLAVSGKEHLACNLNFDVDEEFTFATSLKSESKHVLKASGYEELIDSPIIASKSLQTSQYLINDITFFIHFQGNIKPNWVKILTDFTNFSTTQIQLFGNFPEEEYHFLIQILPYKFYHGVEHGKSTVLVLGSDFDFDDPSFYKTLLGISSHELFHAWNICKIRPKELLPYNVRKECYFPTGFVVEGFTTYYGDLMLLRSGVWDLEQFIYELNENLQNHLQNQARDSVSIYQSSIDLWVDGYQATHPYRKVSIYDKGALIAFMLDVELMQATSNSKDLDSLMQILWNSFGQKKLGYLYQDIIDAVIGLSDDRLQAFFTKFVKGHDPIEKNFAKCLNYIGYGLHIASNLEISAHTFGFKINLNSNRLWISAIEGGSVAHRALSIDDEIVELNGCKDFSNLDRLMAGKNMLELKIVRNGLPLTKVLIADGNQHFLQYQIRKMTSPSDEQLRNLAMWAKRIRT